MKTLKKIPKFKNEDEEFDFWSKNDSTEFIDWSKAVKVQFNSLKKTKKEISVTVSDEIFYLAKKKSDESKISISKLIENFILKGLKKI